MEVEEADGKEPAPSVAGRKRKATSPEVAADVRQSPRKKKAAKAGQSKDSPHSSPQTTPTKGGGSKPVCKYGMKCYQKNPKHRKTYSHPWVREGCTVPLGEGGVYSTLGEGGVYSTPG